MISVRIMLCKYKRVKKLLLGAQCCASISWVKNEYLSLFLRCVVPHTLTLSVSYFSGLVPHTLAILKTAHLLTEKLVRVTLNNAQQLQIPETLTELVSVARRIGARVDDVVRSMYPPLDPRLLEARSVWWHLL